MSINSWFAAFLFVLFLLWTGVYWFFAADTYVVEHFAPPVGALALYLVAAGLTVALRQPGLRLMGTIWTIWPVVGTYFSIGHFYQGKLWASLDLTKPDLIFVSATVAFLLGMHFALAFNRRPTFREPERQWRPIEMLPLLVFPLIYAAVLLRTGSTILSGASLVDDMYMVSRGPIYGLRIALVPVASLMTLYALRSNGRQRLAWNAAIVLTLFTAILDGKRDMALLMVLSIVIIILAQKQSAARGGRLVVALCLTLLAYGAVGKLRADDDLDYTGWISFATIAGIEYRDFAHSVNYWSPEYMETFNYDFFKSSVGALLNSDMLAAFGFDKRDLVGMDSARAWQRASQSEFGIRTGIVSELFFVSPNFWLVLSFMIGAMVTVLHQWCLLARSDLTRILATSAVAAAALAMFSQTSATLGYVMSLVYLTVLLFAWRTFISMTPLATSHHRTASIT